VKLLAVYVKATYTPANINADVTIRYTIANVSCAASTSDVAFKVTPCPAANN
jgi:hypothetical protein